jgi:YD repeat-containing protein
MVFETTYTYDFPSNADKTVFAWSGLVGRFPSQVSALFLMELALTWSVKDPLNRLTNESINNAVSGPNGATGYGYDTVNRTSWSSNLPNVPNVAPTYDPDDRRTSDENFDSNGSTINTGGHSYTYDAEGKLIGVDNGAITLTYDSDGNLISKSNSTTGKTETFLIDTVNPTGYAQIVETQVNGSLANVFNYGPNGIISQGNVASGKTVYFGKDGSNNTRYLMEQSGAVTDTFDYSADGILVNRTGTTPTYNLFQGEHFVPDMGLYWLRARWMNPQVGEFMTMDSDEGTEEDPGSLHKYSILQWDGGINSKDPSGHETLYDRLWDWVKFAPIAGITTAAQGSFAAPNGGPDITEALNNTLCDVYAKFASWSPMQKAAGASAIHDVWGMLFNYNRGAGSAWDIYELAGVGGQDPHPNYMTVSGDCYALSGGMVTVHGMAFLAPQVNYALFGAINKLLGDFANTDAGKDLGLKPSSYSLSNTELLVSAWKLFEYQEISSEAKKEALEFTQFGYNGSYPKSGLPYKTNGITVTEHQFGWFWRPNEM